MICVPAPSAFALAAARLGWSQQDCALLSLHGRPLEAIVPHLQPGARILALSWDGATPGEAGGAARGARHGAIRADRLRGDGRPARARSRSAGAGFALDDVAALNTIALEVVADRGARVLPRARRAARRLVRARRPDHQARHPRDHARRRSRRAAANCCGTSAPARARSPSNGCSPTRPTAPSRSRPATTAPRAIGRNALAFGVPALTVVDGEAPHALGDLPAPDAVFIGGGARAPDVVERAWTRSRPAGGWSSTRSRSRRRRAASSWRARHGGELARIAVAYAEPVGRFSGWRAAMPVVQWRLGQAMSGFVAIGVGCRGGRFGRDDRRARAPRARRGSARRTASGGCSRSRPRREEPGLAEAARLIGAPLTALPLAALRRKPHGF